MVRSLDVIYYEFHQEKNENCSGTEPQTRAIQCVLQQHEPAKAIEILHTTVAYFGFYGIFYPGYLRGQAFLAERQGSAAAAEFQQILEHRDVVISDPIGALAHFTARESVRAVRRYG